jgi:hypothetical protein
MTFCSEYITKQQLVLLRVKNIILCYEDFKIDMFMNMLRLSQLHSIELVRFQTMNLIFGFGGTWGCSDFLEDDKKLNKAFAYDE